MTGTAPGPTASPKPARACQDWLCHDCGTHLDRDWPWCRECNRHVWSWDEARCPYPAAGFSRRHEMWLCRLHTLRHDTDPQGQSLGPREPRPPATPTSKPNPDKEKEA